MFHTSNYFHRTSLTLLLAIILANNSVMGQETISGGPSNNFVLEATTPRTAPNPIEQRDLKYRSEEDSESVASLIKNVHDVDGMIELVVGRSRLITLQEPLAFGKGDQTPVVAIGDPTVIEFDVLPSAQVIRILGRKSGITDLSVVASSGKVYSFEIQVVYDMDYARAYLKQLFPNAQLKLTQMYEHIVVEGEASSADQSAAIIQTLQGFLSSVQTARSVKSKQSADDQNLPGPSSGDEEEGEDGSSPLRAAPFLTGLDEKPDVESTLVAPQIINLIRVPGIQQVMLQVKIAEVNRTALRQMGTSWFYQDSSGRTFGSNLGSSSPVTDQGQFLGLTLGGSSTAFAILPNTSLTAVFDALRNNQVVNVLAEPNLMALHGQKASFLAGGEFPVPVPQAIGGVGGGTITVEFKEFGVLLDFIPYIMDDGAIRLHVAPEVSTIDATIGIVSAGITIPGVNTRRANTTVELRQGQTLALAGLLQVSLEANTRRLPGMGDLPYLGALFSNNSHQRVEKELVILVSPFLVAPLEADQVGPLPGCEIKDADDYEFYLLNRIEGRHPTNNYRATNGWDNPLKSHQTRSAQQPAVHGPYGFSR